MSLFFVDTVGDTDLLKDDNASTIASHGNHDSKSPLLWEPADLTGWEETDEKKAGSELEDDEEDSLEENSDSDESCDLGLFRLPPATVHINDEIREVLAKTEPAPKTIDLEMDKYIERLKIAMDNRFKRTPKKKNFKPYVDLDHTEQIGDKEVHDLDLIRTDVESVLAKSHLSKGLEQQQSLPQHSKREQIKLRRIERAKTKGTDWFDMPAPEITPEIENDLKILKMRSVLDPKRFYKKNDLKVLPKYFQMGVVQHSPLDYYNERDTRRNKKRSLVDELLEDTEAQTYTKRKYKEIMAKKNKYQYRKSMKKMKKQKKQKH